MPPVGGSHMPESLSRSTPAANPQPARRCPRLHGALRPATPRSGIPKQQAPVTVGRESSLTRGTWCRMLCSDCAPRPSDERRTSRRVGVGWIDGGRAISHRRGPPRRVAQRASRFPTLSYGRMRHGWCQWAGRRGNGGSRKNSGQLTPHLRRAHLRREHLRRARLAQNAPKGVRRIRSPGPTRPPERTSPGPPGCRARSSWSSALSWRS
jgi:hypothetical protein